MDYITAKQSIKSLFYRFWWLVIIIIGLTVFGLILKKSSNYENNTVNNIEPEISDEEIKKAEENKEKDFETVGEIKPFTTSELVSANQALASGIKIDDPQYDWVKFPEGSMQPDGRPDNPNPYPLPWTDFKSLSIGADAGFLYIKFEFWGDFPKKQITYNNDTIEGGCGKLNGFTFTNNEGQKDSGDLITSLNFNTDNNGQIQDVDHVAMISPTGRDEHMETIFKIFSKEGMATGGPGTNYLLSAYPLSQFNLKLGDEVTFDSSGENGSTIYHHEAVDIILGHETGKFGDTIKYKLGSNKYEILSSIDNTNHS